MYDLNEKEKTKMNKGSCDNASYPKDVIDVNILLMDETEVTIHFNCD